MCEFERYLELQIDVDEVTTQKEEEAKRENEKSRSQYGAVDFSYDSQDKISKESSSEEAVKPADDKSDMLTVDEEPYICPPELRSLIDMCMPETDKQAQIIERTAVFVARQGNQMEIILKAKQKDNSLFGFLNYDHKLNEFYKAMVKLIRQGRYIPKSRPTVKSELPPEEGTNEPNKSIHDDFYELKLPKVDISNTAYASLIQKFKKVNEATALIRAAATADVNGSSSTIITPKTVSETAVTETTNANEQNSHAESASGDHVAPPEDTSAVSRQVVNPSSPNEPRTLLKSPPQEVPLSSEEYEQCYQEYYKYYYVHYYTQFSEQQTKVLTQCSGSLTEDHQSAIVQQAAKAAAVAASAALNAMYQARTKQKQTSSTEPAMTPGERGIIEKMAEYVARNGLEFEELVASQKGNDPRFGFLKPDHALHSYYLSRRRQFHVEESTTVEPPTKRPAESEPPPESESNLEMSTKVNQSSKSSKVLPSDRQSSISFKLVRPSSTTKLHSNGTSDLPASSLPMNVYVHSSISEDSKTTSSCPILEKEHDSPNGPITPVNSLLSDDDAPSSVRSHERHSRSPVKFSLPGIPSASSSNVSSVESSPERVSPAALSDSTADSVQSPMSPEEAKVTVESYENRTNPLLYPRTDIPCSGSNTSSVRSVDSPQSDSKSTLSVSPFSSNSIEDMLDVGDVRSSGHSASRHRLSSKSEKKLQKERRKRAAELVAQLRSAVSAPLTRSSGSTDEHPYSSAATRKVAHSPPPAPDSVPAAVAHAVVASLKRRHEESLASIKAEAKARRRFRSPPAAYAMPIDRIRRSPSPRRSSKHTRLTPSPVSHLDSLVPYKRYDHETSRDRKHSKHKKHRTTR
ncbi:hypothetical protein P879_01115 [Paragonimus westermani]|uniref:SURP motif domain-containing protein n=1 Tax=Paragonimus westermani TaxID=34504 RepID=A0A8T0D2W8_9TREM|nr:hypothetical protein P879_01115 [Paragonimus westermani]